MPSAYEPKPRMKIIACSDGCGKTLEVGWKTRKPWRCLECGIKRSVAYTTQMHNRSGPHWDAWCARMRALVGEGTATGDTQ